MSRDDYPDPDRIPTRPGLHVATELDDTHDDEPRRRVRVRTPISVPRAETPADDVLAAAVARIQADDPCWGFAHQVKDAIDAQNCRLHALEERAAPRKPWRRLVSLATKALTAGTIIAALGLSARALIAHGDSTAEGRERAAMLRAHERQIRSVLNALSYIAGRIGVQVRLDDNPKD